MPTTSPKPRRSTIRLMERAMWIYRERKANPTILHEELVARTRKRWGCGLGAAEIAIARANEMLRENYKKRVATASEDLVETMFELRDSAIRAGDRAEARKVSATLWRMLGLEAPVKLEVAGKVEHHMSLLDETHVQANRRLAELRAKAQGLLPAASQVIDVPAGPQPEQFAASVAEKVKANGKNGNGHHAERTVDGEVVFGVTEDDDDEPDDAD